MTHYETTIDALNNLITVNLEGEQVYREAAAGMNDDMLQTQLHQYAQEHKEYAEELRNHVWELGEKDYEKKPAAEAAGEVFQTWVNLRKAVATENDVAIIKELDLGESLVMQAYENVLENHEISDNIRRTMRDQFEDIEAIREGLKMRT